MSKEKIKKIDSEFDKFSKKIINLTSQTNNVFIETQCDHCGQVLNKKLFGIFRYIQGHKFYKKDSPTSYYLCDRCGVLYVATLRDKFQLEKAIEIVNILKSKGYLKGRNEQEVLEQQLKFIERYR
jgi:hypothetical protein